MFKTQVRREKRIFLLFHDSHYDLITSPKGFHGTNFYCEDCDKAYDHVERHRCTVKCNTCFRDVCTPCITRVCEDCHRTCRSDECIRKHKEVARKEQSYCEQFYECLNCKKFLVAKDRPQNKHVCGEKYCGNCKLYHMEERHLCFLKQVKPKLPSEKLIFFDFETDQSSGEHVVNFAVAQYKDGKEFVFQGYNSLEDFCKWLFNKTHKGFTVIAHNMKSFDGQFLLK